jgi:hypothetical protein
MHKLKPIYYVKLYYAAKHDGERTHDSFWQKGNNLQEKLKNYKKAKQDY